MCLQTYILKVLFVVVIAVVFLLEGYLVLARACQLPVITLLNRWCRHLSLLMFLGCVLQLLLRRDPLIPNVTVDYRGLLCLLVNSVLLTDGSETLSPK